MKLDVVKPSRKKKGSPPVFEETSNVSASPNRVKKPLPPKAGTDNLEDGQTGQLNLKMDKKLIREIKTYAAVSDYKLNELVELAFNEFRKTHGDITVMRQ